MFNNPISGTLLFVSLASVGASGDSNGNNGDAPQSSPPQPPPTAETNGELKTLLKTASASGIRKVVQFSNANFVMGDSVHDADGELAATTTTAADGGEERPAFVVGEDGETVQEAREAVDEFPANMANGKKYSSEDVAEKRKRLR